MIKYLFFAILLLMSSSQAWAVVTVSSLKITVSEIDFFNSTTGQWVVAGSGTSTFDIGAATPDQTIGNYLSGAKLPNGTYTQIRLTLARTMQLQANDGTYYTDGGTEVSPNGGNPGSYVATITNISANYALGSVKTTNNTGSYQSGEYSVDLSSTQFQATFYSPAFAPFTLTGASKTLVMTFNIAGIVAFDESGPNYAYLNAAPGITVTVD